MGHHFARFVLLALLPLSGYVAATPLDYSDEAHWLCRPDYPNTCATDLSSTVVRADGSTRRERFRRARRAEIDCFYVYPTVSMDPAGNSDTEVGDEERVVIQVQFARFGSVCRTFAPLYRQVTLTALRARVAGTPMPVDGALAYNDVKAAWDHYLEHDNDGRGVVLIGHSQGSGVLTRLIAQEIDGQPIQDQVISALLIGTSNVKVPEGADVGGTFQHMPLCRDAAQTGCIVTFASFRSTIPPPEDTLFGRPRDGQGISACNNPGALAGGKTFLDAYLSAGSESLSGLSTGEIDWTDRRDVDTAFVRVPGLLSGECVSRDGLNYLEVTVNGDVNDARTDDIGGDVTVGGQLVRAWGLHLIDMHLAMGDMVSLVASQGRSWLSRR